MNLLHRGGISTNEALALAQACMLHERVAAIQRTSADLAEKAVARREKNHLSAAIAAFVTGQTLDDDNDGNQTNPGESS